MPPKLMVEETMKQQEKANSKRSRGIEAREVRPTENQNLDVPPPAKKKRKGKVPQNLIPEEKQKPGEGRQEWDGNIEDVVEGIDNRAKLALNDESVEVDDTRTQSAETAQDKKTESNGLEDMDEKSEAESSGQ